MILKDSNETFEYQLRDPEFAKLYVQAALDESRETGDPGIYQVALRDVAQATQEQPMTIRPFAETLTSELLDPEFARAYLADALSESVDEFVVAAHKYMLANGVDSASVVEFMGLTAEEKALLSRQAVEVVEVRFAGE